MADDGSTFEQRPYDIQLTPPARRALTDGLPLAAAAAVYEFIVGPLADNPRRVGAPLRSPFEGFYRARRGDYRVRYLIDDDARVLTVVNISHRRDAYRP